MGKNGKSNADKKARAIKEAVSASQRFYPELKNTFVCPVCMGYTPAERLSDITYGHIIPAAAGGTKTVMLCRKCNSSFGHAQDVAFGDYLHVLKTGRRDILRSKQIPRHFNVNGVKVSGQVVADDKGVGLYIWQDRNNPKDLDAVLQSFAAHGAVEKSEVPPLEVEIRAPLLAQEELVTRGFLTAAYLFWVYEAGYSFALQSHLDPVRDAILGNQSVDPQSVKTLTGRAFVTPWIGTGVLQNEAVLFCGIADRLIIFPLPTNADVYKKLGLDKSTTWSLKKENYTPLTFRGSPPARNPMAIIFGKQTLVMPDVVARQLTDQMYFFVPEDGRPPQVLCQITEAQAELLKDKGVLAVKLEGMYDVPEKEVGRPPSGDD